MVNLSIQNFLIILWEIKGKIFMKKFGAILLSIISVITLLASLNFNTITDNKNFLSIDCIKKQELNLLHIKTKKCNIMNPNRKRTC